MSDEYYTRAPPLECRLMSASMEIDDDDQDVVQVIVEVSNEEAMPIGGLEIFIQTSNKKKVTSEQGISSLGPGLTRKFTFEFPLQKGNWTFMLRSPSVEADLGPFDHDFTFQAEKGRVYNNSIGSGMFTDAFTSDLGDFGQVEERGLIDASSIKMTSYFGENSAGGATAITVGNAPVEESNNEEAPRVPPWQKSGDPLLSAPVTTPTEAPTPTEPTTDSTDLLAFSKQVSQAPVETVTEPPTTTAPTPPTTVDKVANQAPIVADTPPSLPPSAPSSSPPTEPPSQPSNKPPTRPPTGPPSAPPSGPPTGPPTGPPSGPPSAPPTKPPTGPPSGPPSAPPTKPPTGPPSGPPSGPPKSKKPSRPPM